MPMVNELMRLLSCISLGGWGPRIITRVAAPKKTKCQMIRVISSHIVSPFVVQRTDLGMEIKGLSGIHRIAQSWALNQGLLTHRQGFCPFCYSQTSLKGSCSLNLSPVILPFSLPSKGPRWSSRRRDGGMWKDAFLGCRDLHSMEGARGLVHEVISGCHLIPWHSAVWAAGLGQGGRCWSQAVPWTRVPGCH